MTQQGSLFAEGAWATQPANQGLGEIRRAVTAADGNVVPGTEIKFFPTLLQEIGSENFTDQIKHGNVNEWKGQVLQRNLDLAFLTGSPAGSADLSASEDLLTMCSKLRDTVLESQKRDSQFQCTAITETIDRLCNYEMDRIPAFTPLGGQKMGNPMFHMPPVALQKVMVSDSTLLLRRSPRSTMLGR